MHRFTFSRILIFDCAWAAIYIHPSQALSRYGYVEREMQTPVCVIPPPVDERLQVLAVLHLRIVFSLEIPLALGFGRVELRKVPRCHRT